MICILETALCCCYSVVPFVVVAAAACGGDAGGSSDCCSMELDGHNETVGLFMNLFCFVSNESFAGVWEEASLEERVVCQEVADPIVAWRGHSWSVCDFTWLVFRNREPTPLCWVVPRASSFPGEVGVWSWTRETACPVLSLVPASQSVFAIPRSLPAVFRSYDPFGVPAGVVDVAWLAAVLKQKPRTKLPVCCRKGCMN